MNRRAVVIGATGVVGRELVTLLADNEEFSEIITFTRREYEFNNPKVLNYVIDFESIEDYADLVSGEFFFSCLGTTKSQAGSIENQRRVDLDYQAQFAKIAASNGVHHYLLVSSPGANATSMSPYLKMKGELDDQVMSLDFASISLFKPSLIDGDRPDSRPLEKLSIAVSGLASSIPGLKKYKKITGKQIAQKMLFEALKTPRGKNEYLLNELFEIH